MKETGTILIVDDDADILTAARLLLRRSFAEVHVCQDPTRIPAVLAEHSIDAVLLDMNFGPGESSGDQGLDWLGRILAIDPEIVVVMITAHGSFDTVVEAMRLGAIDFIAKPWQNEKLLATMSAAVKLHQSRSESATLRRANRALLDASTPADDEIIGDSGAIRKVLTLVDRAAPTDANVLILGENGTGKELIARRLHRLSRRADEVFLTVDMGSISETLFESELFGHRKGAFTGAERDRAGRFQAAHGGTLFLDEIGNLPPHLQAKLLRALQERSVTPVGADRAESFDVRVIAATNVEPSRLRDVNRFRPDLLFRLNTVEITVPPLRQRSEDIVPIARHFADLYGRKYNRDNVALSQTAGQALTAYPWPGNVRALRHAVERAVILAEGGQLEPTDFQLPDATLPAAQKPRSEAPLNLDQVEKETITAALRKHGYNISRAARDLGLTRASLYRRMEKHGL